MTEPLVPIESLARTLTVSITTVRSWVRTGLIPGDMYVKIGNTYRFDKEAIINHFKPMQKNPVVAEPAPQADPRQMELNFDVDVNL
jgi:hypothetical protein